LFQALALFLYVLKIKSRGFVGPVDLANHSIDLMSVLSGPV
jgi:hypothetical protein